MRCHPLGSPTNRHLQMSTFQASLIVLGSISSTLSYVEANSGSKSLRKILRSFIDNHGFIHAAWATLPMNVPPYLSEDAYIPSTVPVLVGTPPQQINLTVDMSSGFLATYGSDCILCAGTTMFDPSLSSTFRVRPHFFLLLQYHWWSLSRLG